MVERRAPGLEVNNGGSTTTIRLVGASTLGGPLPSASDVVSGLDGTSQLRFDCTELDAWDTGLMVFVQQLDRLCRRRGHDIDIGGLPAGAKRLYRLATAVPSATSKGGAASPGFFY